MAVRDVVKGGLTLGCVHAGTSDSTNAKRTDMRFKRQSFYTVIFGTGNVFLKE